MKHLKIVYGDAVLWDGPVGSLEWSDSESGVKVEGRVRPKPASSSGSGLGGGILDMLSKASKAKTSQMADGKRESYRTETGEPETDETNEPETDEPGAVEWKTRMAQTRVAESVGE